MTIHNLPPNPEMVTIPIWIYFFQASFFYIDESIYVFLREI